MFSILTLKIFGFHLLRLGNKPAEQNPSTLHMIFIVIRSTLPSLADLS